MGGARSNMTGEENKILNRNTIWGYDSTTIKKDLYEDEWRIKNICDVRALEIEGLPKIKIYYESLMIFDEVIGV